MAREITGAWVALGEVPVAVRSSATAEDLEEASFAGQQDTYLNVRGAEALLEAVRECWASLWTERAVAYRARQGIDPAELALAVVVQRMVEADAAGVMFTANPTNGRRDELVLSAAWGLGESVVGGSVTTDDLVVEKAGLRVASRTTADKAVMTVYAQERTAEVPVPADRRRAPVLDDKAAAVLAELGVRVEQHYGAPQDIEWARADGEFYIVQSRPITALPEPEAAPPTEWEVPDPKAFYFRASIVEQLPDPLSPLFAAMVDGSVTRSLQALMREFLRVDVAAPGVGLPTVNGYAYYRYSRAAMWQMTVGGTRAMRRLPAIGLPNWRDVAHPAYQAAVAAWRDRPPADLTDAELLDGVQELLDAGTRYYTAVQAIIPLAAFSEVSFTRFYDALVRRPGEPPASTFLVGFDSAPILAEKSLWSLAEWTRGHPELADAVRADPAAVWAGGGPEHADEWRARFRAHLDRFGHATYNLDFMHPTAADDPAPLFEALRFALDGGSAGPAARQAGVGGPARAADRGRARPARPRRGRWRSPGSCAGPSATRPCARTPWPTSGWPGRRCAGCSPSWAAASSPRAGSPCPRTSTGCGPTRSWAARWATWPSGRRCGEAGGGPRRRRRSLSTRSSTASRGGSRPPASRRARCCTAPGRARARSRRPRGCSPGPPTSAGCSRARCSSRASPRPRGRRCSRSPRPSSPTSAGRCRTARSWRGSTASRRCSARASPPGGSRTGRGCGSTATRARSRCSTRSTRTPRRPPRSRGDRGGLRPWARQARWPSESGCGGAVAVDGPLSSDNDHAGEPRRSGCMILINVKFPVREDKMDEWLALADSYSKAVNAEEGCVSFSFSRSLDDPNLFVCVELFRDAEAGGAHVKTEHAVSFFKAAPDLVSAQPEILYIDSPEVKGFGPMGEIQPR